MRNCALIHITVRRVHKVIRVILVDCHPCCDVVEADTDSSLQLRGPYRQIRQLAIVALYQLQVLAYLRYRLRNSEQLIVDAITRQGVCRVRGLIGSEAECREIDSWLRHAGNSRGAWRVRFSLLRRI